jgi:hypothetical protein
MTQLKLAIPEKPGASGLDTVPFIMGGADCVLTVMEIAGVMELSVALGAVTGPLAAAVGNFMALGAGYAEAEAEIKYREVRHGFSLGVVMGADGVGSKKAAAYFGHRSFARNDFLPTGAKVAAEAYAYGLLSGYSQGRALSPRQRETFWRDLLARGRTLPGWNDFRGESENSRNWSSRVWIEYYIFFSAVFTRFHMAEEGD